VPGRDRCAHSPPKTLSVASGHRSQAALGGRGTLCSPRPRSRCVPASAAQCQARAQGRGSWSFGRREFHSRHRRGRSRSPGSATTHTPGPGSPSTAPACSGHRSGHRGTSTQAVLPRAGTDARRHRVRWGHAHLPAPLPRPHAPCSPRQPAAHPSLPQSRAGASTAQSKSLLCPLQPSPPQHRGLDPLWPPDPPGPPPVPGLWAGVGHAPAQGSAGGAPGLGLAGCRTQWAWTGPAEPHGTAPTLPGTGGCRQWSRGSAGTWHGDCHEPPARHRALRRQLLPAPTQLQALGTPDPPHGRGPFPRTPQPCPHPSWQTRCSRASCLRTRQSGWARGGHGPVHPRAAGCPGQRRGPAGLGERSALAGLAPHIPALTASGAVLCPRRRAPRGGASG